MYSMTSLDKSLDYTCIVEDTNSPVVKLCRYTSNVPRKTELLSNKLEKGDIFALIKLQDVPSFSDDSWLSISLEEIESLNSKETTDLVEITENYADPESQHEDMNCAYCNSGMETTEQYRLVYGYHIVNFHEDCFNRFRSKLQTVITAAKPKLVSHSI